jgi:dihydroorotase
VTEGAAERSRHWLLRGARVVDPVAGEDRVRALRVLDGVLVSAAPEGAPPARVVEAAGLVAAPSFIDPHVHFREPGDGRSETTASGLAAAERGGYGAVFCMANTDPVNDTPAITEAILRAARASGSPVRLHVVAAATRGLLGREEADLAALKAAGASAVSDDGKPVVDDAVMGRVLVRAAELGLPVFSHCETPSLHPGGVAHDGEPARRLGLRGIPGESEARMVRRDVALAERLRVPVHVCHLSTAAAVAAVREAKGRGVPVTAEAAPHHLALSDEDLLRTLPGGDPDAHLKMNPPLRALADRDAVVAGLLDGTIDCVATDHAPHPEDRKRGCGFVAAAFGVIGLENAFATLHDRLVVPGRIPLATLLRRMSAGAAAVARLPAPGLADGSPAAVVLLDLEARVPLAGASFASLSRNCPFDGQALQGRVAGLLAGDRLLRFAP